MLMLSIHSFAETGIASHYSTRTGTKTASGEKLNDSKLTAAHKTLKLGTKVKVTNLKNKKSVIVKITDRGPYVKKRIIDLSQAAAKELGMLKSGLARVKVEVLPKTPPKSKNTKQQPKKENNIWNGLDTDFMQMKKTLGRLFGHH